MYFNIFLICCVKKWNKLLERYEAPIELPSPLQQTVASEFPDF